MSSVTIDREYLAGLLGPNALAKVSLFEAALADYRPSTPIADLILSALNADGTVTDEAVFARLTQVVGETR